MSGTPAFTRNAIRFAKRVCSLVEKRINEYPEKLTTDSVTPPFTFVVSPLSFLNCSNALFIHHAEHFFDTCLPRARLGEAVFKHGGHTPFDPELSDFGGRSLAHDCLADGRVSDEYLADRHAAGVAGVSTCLTALAVIEDVACFNRCLKRNGGKSLFSDLVYDPFLLAFLTDLAHQTLADGDIDGRGNEIGVNAHIEEARKGRRRVVGVEGGEKQGAGERRV